MPTNKCRDCGLIGNTETVRFDRPDMTWRCENCRDAKKMACILRKTEKLIDALTKDIASPRELCALMSEGEGNHLEIYQAMSKSAMKQIDEAIEEWRAE